VKPIPENLARRLHREAHAERWSVPLGRFTEALQASADRATPTDVARYLSGLHLEDLALACACASGDEPAWEHFVREHRPVLYRAADAIDPPRAGAGGFAVCGFYGIRERDGNVSRCSAFPRPELARDMAAAVPAQRHVDACAPTAVSSR
jgi:hypothetical protein